MTARAPLTVDRDIARRVDAFDWAGIAASMDELGLAAGGVALLADECAALVAGYDDDTRYRSTIDMARHRFGAGEYRYFAHPLPTLVAELRAAFWPHLLPIARDWWSRLGRTAPWPDDLTTWLDECHAAGQARPTPLILSYRAG